MKSAKKNFKIIFWMQKFWVHNSHMYLVTSNNVVAEIFHIWCIPFYDNFLEAEIA